MAGRHRAYQQEEWYKKFVLTFCVLFFCLKRERREMKILFYYSQPLFRKVFCEAKPEGNSMHRAARYWSRSEQQHNFMKKGCLECTNRGICDKIKSESNAAGQERGLLNSTEYAQDAYTEGCQFFSKGETEWKMNCQRRCRQLT